MSKNNTDKETEQVEKETEQVEKETEQVEKEEEKSELDLISEELASTKDMLLRTAAELDNFKKRTEKEKSELSAFVKASVLKTLLPVADNIARASLAEKGSDDYFKGLELITKQLCDVLKQLGLEEIECLNQPFNPNFHEAVMHIEDENYGENTVVEILQAGYKSGDIVIRPAMVKVAN
ncbi:MAG: nucleotide exchange factor GrpE [Acutalibacteraceae bacterium]|nr:nucleotide exchange factor GrpE [Acutalibacteraceae bacterium]